MGHSGHLELGCVFKVLHELIANYELRFTLQFLEGLATSRPGKYSLNASISDFANDLQRFSDAERNTSSKQTDRVVSSLVSQICAAEIASMKRGRSESDMSVRFSRNDDAKMHIEAASEPPSPRQCTDKDTNKEQYIVTSAESVTSSPEGHAASSTTGSLQNAWTEEVTAFKAASSESAPDQLHAAAPSVPRSSQMSAMTRDANKNATAPVSQMSSFVSTPSTGGRGFGAERSQNPAVEEIDLDDVSLEQAAWLAEPSDMFIISPNQRFHVALDFFVLVLILVECISLPLSVSFSIEMPASFQILSTTLFTLDMLVSFMSGYHHCDLLIMKRSWITKNYLRGWFGIDTASLLPWEELMKLASVTGAQEGGTRTTFLRILKLGKLLRVLRLLRLAKLSALIKRLQGYGILPANMTQLKFGMSVTKMFVVFGFLSHWAACVWGWLGTADNIGHDTADDAYHDVVSCTMGGPCEPGIVGSPWIHRYGLDNYGKAVQYFTALQFCCALITGGQSPMDTGHPIERLFAVIVMITSIFVQSVVVGEILLIMNREAESRMIFDETMQHARDFMTARKVPSPLQLRVYRYIKTQHAITHGANSSSDRRFLAVLSDVLQTELVLHLNYKQITQHPFFFGLSEHKAALDKICVSASPVIYAATEFIVEKGKPATCAHWIVAGKVRVDDPVLHKGKASYLYLRPPSWLGDFCLFVDTLRQSTVMAVVTTETLCLMRSCLDEVCQEYPAVQQDFLDFQQRCLIEKWDALVCPFCHDCGHWEDSCPERKLQAKRGRRVSRVVAGGISGGVRSRLSNKFLSSKTKSFIEESLSTSSK